MPVLIHALHLGWQGSDSSIKGTYELIACAVMRVFLL
jgi:hypothetical protein